MATRRSLRALHRHLRPRLFVSSVDAVAEKPQFQTLVPASIDRFPPSIIPCDPFRSLLNVDPMRFFGSRCFSSRPIDPSDDEEVGEDEEDSGDDEGVIFGSKSVGQSGKSDEERRSEAAEIGYEVIGQLDSSENPFKPYEPVFAVVQIGSHQFKVSNGDSIFTEKLKYCDVNDKLVLNKVLMLGSRTETVIGRPIVPDATVHAVVEEHALDAKVIIFKKKRRKNYRRTKGHRQELTKLRITDIQGIDKSESFAVAA